MKTSVYFRYASLASISVVGLVNIYHAFWIAIICLALNIWLEKSNEELLDSHKEYEELLLVQIELLEMESAGSQSVQKGETQ
jgi:hypothetical protein